mgnify:CR=1 FL=1
MLKGIINLPGDKSISHRVLILASISKGESTIYNLSQSQDVKRTINILKNCGIKIRKNSHGVITIIGETALQASKKRFYCGNSGSTARFMLGFLPTQGISGILYGDKSLSRRPMNRIIEPLKKMGVQIHSKSKTLPISFKASSVYKYNHTLKVPSAQVKTALILASLTSIEEISIKDKFNTRDHTEKLIEYLGYKNKNYSKFIPKKFDYTVAGDISSAAFLISAVILIPESTLIIEKLLYNRTRIGYINILKKMGAQIRTYNERIEHNERVCDIEVNYTKKLKGIILSADDIISMIDEIPIFALVASYAHGKSKITDGEELRYKESDRIKAITYNLKKFNANIQSNNNGFIINGPNKLYDTTINTFGDHRIAMMCIIAKLIITGKLLETNQLKSLVSASFPEFYKLIKRIHV